MQAPPYGGMQPQQPPPVAAPKRYDGKNGTPMYDQNHGGHYGASAGIAASGHAPPPETFTGHWQNVSRTRLLSIQEEKLVLTLCYRYRKD